MIDGMHITYVLLMGYNYGRSTEYRIFDTKVVVIALRSLLYLAIYLIDGAVVQRHSEGNEGIPAASVVSCW